MPQPSCVVTVPTFSEQISLGNWQDPVTKSSLTKPFARVMLDNCEEETYEKFTASISINERIDCKPLQQASLTISGFLPHKCTKANKEDSLDALVAALSDEIKAILVTVSP